MNRNKRRRLKKQRVQQLLVNLKAISINSDKAKIKFDSLLNYRRKNMKTINLDVLFWEEVEKLYNFIMNIGNKIVEIVKDTLAYEEQKNIIKNKAIELEKMLLTLSRITYKHLG